jgi:ATP-dependent DNA ligase
MNLISQYKQKVASRYLPVNPDDMLSKIMESEYYFASVKYDGHFGVLEIKGGNARLYGSDGTERKIDAIAAAAKKIKKDVLLAGEICCFSNDKSQTNLHVSAALDNPNQHDIRFGVFDILELEGNAFSGDLKEKIKTLSEITGDDKIFCIKQELYESRKDIAAFYTETIKEAEGIVVRTSSGIVYKVKPVISLDLVVLGYALQEDQILREFLLGFVTAEGKYQIVTRCGNGFSEKDRKDWVKLLEPLHTNSDYTEVSGAKTAFIFVEPKLTVEIKCLDLINETTKGSVKKMLLSFDAKGYQKDYLRNTLSCIAPVFIRLRKDKNPDQTDAGEAQTAHIISSITAKKEEAASVSSEIFKREVYTKSGKGGTAVRKFIALKTNKENSGYYAPYNVVYTDFSGGRKEPLEQEIYLCSTEKEAIEKIVSLKEENIKKGWEPIK